MSARLRVIVADDERPARSFLVALLRSFEDVMVVGEAASGKEVVALIEKEQPDFALLDLQMPELDGIGVVRSLKKSDLPLIAFVTAYDEYAVKAFEVNAVDYLLKPVDKARLRETLNRAQERIEHAEIVAEQASRVGAATRNPGEHGSDHQSEPYAWWHARRLIEQRTETSGEPAAVAGPATAVSQAVSGDTNLRCGKGSSRGPRLSPVHIDCLRDEHWQSLRRPLGSRTAIAQGPPGRSGCSSSCAPPTAGAVVDTQFHGCVERRRRHAGR